MSRKRTYTFSGEIQFEANSMTDSFLELGQAFIRMWRFCKGEEVRLKRKKVLHTGDAPGFSSGSCYAIYRDDGVCVYGQGK